MLNIFVFICQMYVFFDKMSVFLLVTEKLINVLELEKKNQLDIFFTFQIYETLDVLRANFNFRFFPNK